MILLIKNTQPGSITYGDLKRLYWVTLVETYFLTFQNWSMYSLFKLIDPHPLLLNVSLFTEIQPEVMLS